MPTHNWASRVKLHGIVIDIQTLVSSNRNGRNDKDIAILIKERDRLLDLLGDENLRQRYGTVVRVNTQQEGQK